MRIALVSQEYPPETAKGGLGTQTLAKARGLSALGHDVTVVSRSTDALGKETKDGRLRVVRIGGFERAMPLHTEVADWVTYSAAVAKTVAALNAEAAFDIVDFPEWGAEGFVHLINRTEWYHIPTVVHLHGPLVMLAHTLGWPEPESEFFKTGTFLEGTSVRLADAIVSSSRCSLDWCVKTYGINPAGVPIIHTGIDTALFSPRNTPKSARPTVLFAGKLARNKGVFELLDAALELRPDFPDLHLRILGRGDDKVASELRNRASAAGAADMLDLPGFVPHAELPDHLSRAHIFAAPSIYEGGPGFVYLEAMACGLPAIACSGSGAAEVVHDGKTGFLVPPGDVAALATTLRRLLEDEDLRTRIGSRARAYTEAEADTRVCLDRLNRFYLSVTGK